MATTSEWTAFHARLHQTLRNRNLLPTGQTILIAVSGGQDSLCLAKLLLDLQSRWQWQLAIAHCDHQWRTDSTANADHVETLTQTWKVPCYRATWSRTTAGSTSEAAARQWRYEVLTELAQQHHCQAVVTGHTASDRAETLLYNLMRGSGSDGLQSLQWERSLATGIKLVRPLLEWSREETAQVCQQFKLPVWEDSTNQDLAYARNRIRQELIPYLKQHFNLQVEQHLAQTCEVLQAEVAYLNDLTQQTYAQVKHPDRPALQRHMLKNMPLALQRRIIRQFLAESLPSSPNFTQIEKLVHLLTAPNRSCSDPFPGGAIAQIDGDWLVLRPNLYS